MVENASQLASRLGVSTFLIGVVIIGFGTSAPEMFVSAMAALENKGNLALGNALGSNITNIGLVLGSAAMIKTMTVSRSATRIDIPVVMLVGLVSVALVYDGLLSNLNGYALLLLLATYLVWSARNSDDSEISSSRDGDTQTDVDESTTKATWLLGALSIGSIVVLIIASKLLVNGAVTIAQIFNVNELIIGLTIVAIGTSLPELAAAVAAARKGVHDMIIGNIIGSNVFNTLGVLGITGAIQATEIETSAIYRDFPIMFAFTAFMLVCALNKGAFGRRAGLMMLSGYVLYVCYLVFTTIK